MTVPLMYSVLNKLSEFIYFYILYRKKRSRHKISSVKNVVIGKCFATFLPASFFAWLSENMN